MLLLLPQEQGDYLASTVLETRSHRTTCETHFSFARQANGRSTSCAFPYTDTSSQPKGTTKPTVYSYRRQWNTPVTWTFGLVFQQAIDRQDRTLQTEGRFSLLEPLEIQPSREHSHYRTRTRPMTTCLVGYTPLRLLHPAGHTTTRHFARHLAGDRLRIDSSHRTWTFKTTVIKTRSRTTLTTDYLARPTKWEPISYAYIKSYRISHLATNSSASTTFMYNPVLSVVRIDAKHSWQPYRCQYHGSIISALLLRIQLCIHCFCNIPQTTESLLLYSCCLYSTGISPLYFETIPPWPLPRPPRRPRLSSRLVRKVVPELVPERTSVRTTIRSLLLLLLLLLLSLLLQEDVPPERRTILSLSLLRPILLLWTTCCSQDARRPVP